MVTGLIASYRTQLQRSEGVGIRVAETYETAPVLVAGRYKLDREVKYKLLAAN